MRFMIASLGIIVMAAVLPLQASDDVKTLPSGMYDQMKSGKKFDKVWVSPAYDKAKGFRVGPLEYKAEMRNGELMEYMPKALASLAKSDSPFTLYVSIVKVTTKTFTGFGNVMGSVTVEGRIQDSNGQVVVAFKVKEKAGSFGSGKDDYSAAADKIASDIAAEL